MKEIFYLGRNPMWTNQKDLPSLPDSGKQCFRWSVRVSFRIERQWQGSSGGQSARFIPALSGVQIPPLLPIFIKSGS